MVILKIKFIRDDLFIGCTNKGNKDKIIQKEKKLRLGKSFLFYSWSIPLQGINYDMKKIDYVKYDWKKSGSKNSNPLSSS